MISAPSRSTTGRGEPKYSGTMGISSRWMYCHTSSSVQLDRGNTRRVSPGLRRTLYVRQSSGRCCLGSQRCCAERREKTRSLARDFSSSRRAPPKARSKPHLSSACFRPWVFHMSVCTADPWVNGLIPSSRHSGFWCTSRSRPSSAAVLSRNSYICRNFQVVSTWSSGNGGGAGKKAFLARCSMTELSLPIEYSITGRSLSATASRMMWMLSASSRCRCVSVPVTVGSPWSLDVSRHPADRRERLLAHLGPAHDQIRQERVWLVVAERRAVEPGRVQPGGSGDGDRRGRVPLVLTAAVHVEVGLAADDGGHLEPRGAHGHQVGAERLGHPGRDGGRATPAHGHAPRCRAVAWRHHRRGVGRQHRVQAGERHGSGDQCAVLPQRHVHGPVGPSLRVLAGAVERIDDPDPGRPQPGLVVGGLLRQHGVTGPGRGEAGGERLLGRPVAALLELRGGEAVQLVPHPAQPIAGRAGEGHREFGVGELPSGGGHGPTSWLRLVEHRCPYCSGRLPMERTPSSSVSWIVIGAPSCMASPGPNRPSSLLSGAGTGKSGRGCDGPQSQYAAYSSAHRTTASAGGADDAAVAARCRRRCCLANGASPCRTFTQAHAAAPPRRAAPTIPMTMPVGAPSSLAPEPRRTTVRPRRTRPPGAREETRAPSHTPGMAPTRTLAVR